MSTSNFLTRVSQIQNELKAPKGQFNKFGNYNYRSCEDILEAAKPICSKHEIILNLSDTMELIGDRIYVKATAKLIDIESKEELASTAYAREALQKKGMDESQITGTASSYARKYALNGLLNIDDTKDADTNEYRQETPRQSKAKEERCACAKCGDEIKGVKFNNGKAYTVETLVSESKQRFGKPLCYRCLTEEIKNAGA